MGGKRLVRIAAAISLLALLAAFADVALIASNVPKVPKEEPLPVIYDKPLDKPAEECRPGVLALGVDHVAAQEVLAPVGAQPDRGHDALRDDRRADPAAHVGGKNYGGHIVLLCGWDGEAVTFHDPYEGVVRLSREQYEQVDWAYFIAIGSAE